VTDSPAIRCTVEPPLERWFLRGLIKALGADIRDRCEEIRSEKNAFADLGKFLSFSSLERILCLHHLEPPQLRLFKNGTEVLADAYTGTHVTRRRRVIRSVDVIGLKRQINEGATLVLDTLDTLDPQTREAAHCLQWACRELVQVNGCLTSPGASGFCQDWDDHDVIVVQVAGAKTWSFGEGGREYPLYRDIEFEREGPEGEPSCKLRLAAGDVLYVARGVWHVAEAEDTPSRHVSFGVGRRTPLDSLTFVTDRLRSEVFFRRDIERTNPKSAHETVTRFASTAQDPDFEDFLIARNENSTARKFAQFPWATETKNLVCVADFPPVIVEHTGSVGVRSCRKSLEFSGKATAVLHRALTPVPKTPMKSHRTQTCRVRSHARCLTIL